MSNTSDLDQLDAAIAAADGEAFPDVPELPPVDENGDPLPAPPDYNTEAAAAVDIFAALLIGVCPEAVAVWTDDTKDRVAAALAPVLEKYGVTIGNLPPELMLAIVAAVPLAQSMRMLAMKFAQAKAAIGQSRESGKVEARTEELRAGMTAAAGQGVEKATITQVHPQMGLYKQ